MLLVTSLFAMLALQGCSNGLVTKSDDVTEKSLVSSGEKKLGNQQFHQSIIPEMDIIREMYESGCLIKELELNRRQQNLRISCVESKNPVGFTTGTL